MGWENRGMPSEIDHRNRDPSDNSRLNLRSCDRSHNIANRGVRADSKSGIKGVYWRKLGRSWYAGIRVNGKAIHLGHFDTKENWDSNLQ
jgi:hypothetical protein